MGWFEWLSGENDSSRSSHYNLSRQQTAIHEAGHLAGIDEGGMHTSGARVHRDGGFTGVDYGTFSGRRGSKADSIAALAGAVAERRWLEENGYSKRQAKEIAESHSQHDFSMLPASARRNGTIDPSLHRAAKKLVDRNWDNIKQTADEMAASGSAKRLARKRLFGIF